MKGHEVMDIDSLYAFERVQWRYPGLLLAQINSQAVIGGGYDYVDEEYKEGVDLGARGMVLLVFTAIADGRRLVSGIPLMQGIIEDVNETFAEYCFEEAELAMKKLVAEGYPDEDEITEEDEWT
jgi:hypothetical protein